MSETFDPMKNQLGFLRAEYASLAFGQRQFGRSWFLYDGPILAHYTNLSGMVGIIEGGGFWLSDVRFLNDAEEFDNGRRLAHELIEVLVRRTRHKPFARVLGAALELLGKPLREPYYVASFSRDPDSLEQWRAYAVGADGVTLVFKNEFPAKDLTHFVVLPVLRPTMAIYDDLKKKRVLLNTIIRFALEYRKDVLAGENSFTSSSDIWAQYLVGALSHNFLTFKHPAFQAENEIRIVAHASQVKSFGGIKHRVSGGRIVPYLTSAALYDDAFINAGGSKQLPLREVVVGPIAKQEVTIESIKVFLANSGYDSVLVRPSSVPYRG